MKFAKRQINLLKSLPVVRSDKPLSKLPADFLAPFEQAPINWRFGVTPPDYFFQMHEALFTASVTPTAVVRFLAGLFPKEGYPDELVTGYVLS